MPPLLTPILKPMGNSGLLRRTVSLPTFLPSHFCANLFLKQRSRSLSPQLALSATQVSRLLLRYRRSSCRAAVWSARQFMTNRGHLFAADQPGVRQSNAPALRHIIKPGLDQYGIFMRTCRYLSRMVSEIPKCLCLVLFGRAGIRRPVPRLPKTGFALIGCARPHRLHQRSRSFGRLCLHWQSSLRL
jgi:hypothetical protein